MSSILYTSNVTEKAKMKKKNGGKEKRNNKLYNKYNYRVWLESTEQSHVALVHAIAKRRCEVDRFLVIISEFSFIWNRSLVDTQHSFISARRKSISIRIQANKLAIRNNKNHRLTSITSKLQSSLFLTRKTDPINFNARTKSRSPPTPPFI